VSVKSWFIRPALFWTLFTFAGTTFLLVFSKMGREWAFPLYTVPVLVSSLMYGWRWGIGVASCSLFFTLLGLLQPVGYTTLPVLLLIFKLVISAAIYLLALVTGNMANERNSRVQQYLQLHDEYAFLRSRLESADDNLRQLVQASVQALAAAIDANDARTSAHLKRVAVYATSLAKALGLNDVEVDLVKQASLLHDVGKIGIKESILEKPGKLTPEEFAQVQKHPVIGRNILSEFRTLDSILPLVVHHHEHYNGRGYPYHCTDGEIPLGARIIAVADAFDAMTSDRPYRPAMTPDEAVAELKRCAGSQFDPEVVEVFLNVMESEHGHGSKSSVFRNRGQSSPDKELTFLFN